MVTPNKQRGKHKPLPAQLQRIGIIREFPEHELTSVCGSRKQAIGKEVSEQLEIVPRQIRVINRDDCKTGRHEQSLSVLAQLGERDLFKVSHPKNGFEAMLKRWVVERTHVWNERARRAIMQNYRMLAMSKAWGWLAKSRMLECQITT